MNTTIILAISGFLVSLATYRIGKKAKENSGYHAFCDFNDRFSCSKVITSPYGAIAGFSNSVYGLCFYAILIFLALAEKTDFIWYLSMAGMMATIFLMYILYFRVKNVCLLCNLIYIINILLFLNSTMLSA